MYVINNSWSPIMICRSKCYEVPARTAIEADLLAQFLDTDYNDIEKSCGQEWKGLMLDPDNVHNFPVIN